MKKILVVNAVFVAFSTPALSQENNASGGIRPLDEIVVTAQRREENLQTVPISATALDGDALKDKGIERILDLQRATPSLSVTDTGITLSVNIRGIGIASDSPNVTAGVATYVDGLFQPPIVQANSFYDLQGVEVLRGPQGTFVGSNSTGGAIFINSRDPELDTWEGYAAVEAGNFDKRGFEGALNIPLTRDLALRVAGFTQERDSYFDDAGPFDNDAGKLDEYGARVGLLWSPGALEMLLKMQTNDRDTGGYAYRPIQGTQFSDYRSDDIRTLNYSENTSYGDSAHMTSFDVRYELDSGIELRSLSGFQNKTVENISDTDASQAPASVGGGVVQDYYANEKQYSQEINIISPTDGVLDWVLGAYYQRNDISVRIHNEEAGFPTDILPQNKRETTGVFAQGNYALRPDLELQVGARYSTYEASGTGSVSIGRGIPGFPPGGLTVSDLSGKHDDNRVTGKVALNWNVNESHLLFALVSRGYKPGGFNSQTSTFAPEEVLSYEAGWKGSFVDGSIRTQFNVFYNDYSDFQFSVLEPSTGFGGVDNLSDLTIKGMEAQIQGRFGSFSFDASVGYTDSDLEGMSFVNERLIPAGTTLPQCPVGTPPDSQTCFDYRPYMQETMGGDALYSPELTFNMGAEYTFYLEQGLQLTPRASYAYVGEQYTYLAYSPLSDRLESRKLVNASLALSTDVWTIEAYGSNLTDQEYVSGQFGISEFYGSPREYGVRARMNF